MPNRIIREGVLTSERVDKLDAESEVFYRRLMSVVDDHGRFFANPKLIRAACYPLRLDSVTDDDVSRWITVTHGAGLLIVYRADDGKTYVQLENFGQRVQSKSKFPEPKEKLDIHGNPPWPTVENRLVGGEGEDVLVTPNGVTRPPAADAPPASLPDCPAQRIVDLYHEKLPELPRCEKLTSTRRGYLRQRWREDLETLDDWTAFFADVRKSDFLMGKKPGRDGRPPFRADLEWLTKPANYAKFIEGKYHRAA